MQHDCLLKNLHKVLNSKINDDWRIFARAAADDKGPIVMLLNALKFLNTEGITPKFNIKINPEQMSYIGRPFVIKLHQNNFI